MPDIQDFKPETRFFALFAGASKSGKSTAAASYPEPYYEIDPDMRFAGIHGSVQQGLLKQTKISYQQFDPLGGWEPIDKVLQQLLINKIQANSNSRSFPYKTIGLGSLGSLARILGTFARKELKGQSVGTMRLPAPGDARVEYNGIYTVLDTLKSMPCNVICTAHIVERWGKPPAREPGDEYLPNVVIGEQLNLHPNLASGILSGFDNVFRFERKIIGGKEKYYVQFSTDVAGNSYGIPPGEFDITDQQFYPWFQRLTEAAKTTRKYEELVKIK